MNRHQSRSNWSPALLSLLLLATAVPCAADPGSQAKASAQAAGDQAWVQSIKLIESGEFDEAAQRLDDLKKLGPDGGRVAEWLATAVEMERDRAKLTSDDRQKYIAWVQEQREKGNIDNALAAAVRAFDNCTDQDEFRANEWLLELQSDALAKAAQLREKEEWLDAHGIYYQLSEIFTRSKSLKKLRRQCLSHARLELSYKPDAKWEDYLHGIEGRMVEEAMWKIDKYYVTDADFRSMTEAALEQLITLVSTPALQEVFPSLKNEFDRNDFTHRTERLIRRVHDASTFGQKNANAKFNRSMDINRQTIQLPDELIISEFMNAAMHTLDEFSSVIWPIEYKEFDKHTRGDFIGVGISISRPEGRITVVTPLEDSPAYAAGIMADDVIIKVDGESTEKMSLTDAVKAITGPVNTSVTLTIQRPDVEDELDFELKRAKVTLQSVKGLARNQDDPQQWDFMLDEDMGIGYIRVGSFQGNTVAQLYQTITDLLDNHNLEGLILDLRFNPGGLLTSAVRMSELFLTQGDRIVSTKGERAANAWEIDAQHDGPFQDLPLVVLINGQSASASEIVSGALRDHHRATIIGERTFGKFSVQNLMQLAGTDAHLKLTTAAYFLPSGKSLHRTPDAATWGVDPDIEVAVVPKELYQIAMLRRASDVLGPRGAKPANKIDDDQSTTAKETPAENDEPAAADKIDDQGDSKPADESEDPDAADAEKEKEVERLPEDPNDRPEIDPQLETALFVLRVKLLEVTSPQMAYQVTSKFDAEMK